jgi:hypothetical protein
MRLFALLSSVCLICLSVNIARANAIHTRERTITVDDRERTY